MREDRIDINSPVMKEEFLKWLEDAPDSVQSFYIINRVNGKLLYKNQVNKFTVGDPYYDENLVKQVKNLKPSKELPKSAIDALLNGSTSSGKCKKTKKVKTIF